MLPFTSIGASAVVLFGVWQDFGLPVAAIVAGMALLIGERTSDPTAKSSPRDSGR